MIKKKTWGLLLSICCTLAGPQIAFADGCDPLTTVCLGSACSENNLGMTILDYGKKNIIACLVSDSGSDYIWKAMTSQSTPSTAVVSFYASECPTGWSLFEPAMGRTIVGAGSGNKDMNNVALTSRGLNEAGGEETHKLTIDQMPSHRHAQSEAFSKFVAYDEDLGGGYSSSGGQDSSAGEVAIDSMGGFKAGAIEAYIGGSNAHNTMMPYYTLLYCVKD